MTETKAETVNQPSAQPTNKLTWAAIGAGVGSAIYSLAEVQWPFLKNPEVKLGLMPLVSAAFAFGPGWVKAEASRWAAQRAAGKNWYILGGAAVIVVGGGFLLGMLAF